MALSRLDLPNVITVARIVACPAVFVLIFSTNPTHLALAFVLFVVAAASDLWDGYLARKHGWITDTGKLLDPVADKLLLFSTLVPFFIVSRRPDVVAEIPWWGALPLWVIAVIFLRELSVTLVRAWAARRGRVLAAGSSGKMKALSQNIFSGALILWYSLARAAENRGWEGQPLWEAWSAFHGGVVGLMLAIAIVLTVYSMGVYYWQNRALLGGSRL
jgi:CDP-diacylglycerol--glycerol-3-phosphate 3-phosphatidyltransferase